jgi:uncharacterized protein involved in exopolysaccharide biosynthesis/Mrp family chromosome partitioning ATPase
MFGFKSKKAPAAAPAPVIAPPPPMPSFGGEPDMRGVGRELWRRKSLILLTTVIVAGISFVVVNSLTPRYRSEARILLEIKENVFLRAEADKGADRTALDPEAVSSQVQLVLSRDLARDVIKKEKLAEKAEFDNSTSLTRLLLGAFGLGRDPSSMSAEERILEAYYDHLSVYPIDKSRVIVVEFRSADPDLAARVTNAIAEGYLGTQQSAKQDQTRAASQWLAGEIANMRQRVQDAEAKIEQYRAKSNLYVGSNNSSLPNQQLTEINSQISAARGQKADLEARARQLRELLRSGKPIDSSDIANSESMRRLSEQRAALAGQLAEQSSTLLDQHPRIKELRAQIGELDRQMRSEAERLARALDNDAKVAGNRVETLVASLDQVKKVASQTNEQDVELRALEREGKAQRDLLESYLVKYREASARENINVAAADARIISRATPAVKPDFPKKLPSVLIASFAAFILSSGFVVTGALLAPAGAASPYGYPMAYAQAPVPMAHAMPYVPMAPPVAPAMPAQAYVPPPQAYAPPPRMAATPVLVKPARSTGPMVPTSMDDIVRGLLASGELGRRVTVVGAARNVGTTFAAIALARSLAKQGRVILVDLAFGAPNLSVISTDANAPGIAELIRGQASFGDVITRDQFSAVHLIATGNIGADGAALAASPLLATMIEALARTYDHVVIDIGAAPEVPVEHFASLAARAVLVAADPANPATHAARERLAAAGFADVMLLIGGAQAVAA